jgi:hypothetical protein
MSLQTFYSELKHRKVFRVVAVYAVVAFGVAQVADSAAPGLLLPDWSFAFVLFLLILGFPGAIARSPGSSMWPGRGGAHLQPQTDEACRTHQQRRRRGRAPLRLDRLSRRWSMSRTGHVSSSALPRRQSGRKIWPGHSDATRNTCSS